MKKLRRIIAVFLCFVMLFTMNCGDLFASEQTDGTAETKGELLLNYLLIGNDYVPLGEEQFVVAQIGDGTVPIGTAEICYRNNTTGEVYTKKADTIDSSAVLFRLLFEEEADAGSYEVVSIAFTTENESGSITMQEAGIEAYFGVDQKVETKPDDLVLDEAELLDAASVVCTDGDGAELTPEAFGNAVETAAEGITESAEVRATKAGTLTIVLDPGHGGNDPGAIYFGLKESLLTLKIAAYCKAELETYAGVKVYMTRSTDATLGATTAESLDNRVATAQKYNADVLVSFHLNANENAAANGISVYYPNNNYNPLIGNEGNGLAQKIQKELVALGIKDNKALIWNASSDKYPDGSAADYLGLIRRAKLAGFPCVLIEHAFLSNSSDVTNYLNSDEKLKKIGVADATGIALYYNLKKTPEELTPGEITEAASDGNGSITVTWNGIENVDGYELYRSDALEGEYVKIADLLPAALTYTDSTVAIGTTYYYKIRAAQTVDGVLKYGDFSETKWAAAMIKTAISSIKSQSNGKLLITWNHIAGIAEYEVYRSVSNSGTYKKVATVSDNFYEDGKVTLNKRYYYKVRTVSRSNGENAYGEDSAVKYGVQAKATSITSVQNALSGLKISWKKASGASGYYIYRSKKKKGTYKLIATVKKAKTVSYTDESVDASTVYYYKVQVKNRSGKNVGGGKLSAPVSGKSAARTTISGVQSVDGAKLKVTWKKTSGAIGYQVARSASKNGTYKVIKEITSAKIRNYTDTSVKAGKKYYYKVSVKSRADGHVIYGGYSAPVSGRALKAAKITSVAAAADASLEVKWSKVTGAGGYQIYRSTKEKSGYKRIATVSSGKTTKYKDTPAKTNKMYYYKVRPYSASSGKKGYGAWSGSSGGKAIAIPVMSMVSVNQDGSLQLSWSKVSGASGYQLYRNSGSGDFQKIAETTSSVRIYADKNVVSGVSYQYRVQAYNEVNGAIGSSGFSAAVGYTIPYQEIMGAAQASIEQMVKYYNANILTMQKAYPDKNYHYPSELYADKGAADIETFIQILYEEASYEAIRPEVIFAQICNETYFLQFGSDVKAEQCNFAGIGATGDGEPGVTFADVRTGIRAQVQHMKAYACTDELRYECVDPRFIFVKRGSAKYVEWLGIQENPYTVWNTDGSIASGCGWATAKNYGYNLIAIINRIKSY